MNFKKILLFAFLFFSVCIIIPKDSKAAGLQEAFVPVNSFFIKVQEGFEYLFTFKIENKVQVLERHAEKRLVMAKEYAEDGNNERVQNVLQNYLQIKDKQDDLLGKMKDGEVLGSVEERTIEQQKTMEEIKTKVDGDTKQNTIQVQEQVVNQVAKRVIEVNGKEGQTEFLNKVEHVWAPGTGPGGSAGVIYEGGGKLMFAPGTSGGGAAGSDIKTVEVKTGGGPADVAPVNNSGSNFAPGTTQGGSGGNTIDPGGVDPGTSSDGENRIDP